MSSMFSLDDKVCVITGGGGDLGRAVGKAFLAQGAFVLLAGRSEAALVAAKNELGGASAKVGVAICDVSNEESVEALLQQVVGQYGRADVLVTAAGVQYREPVLTFPSDQWDCLIRTNLTGTFYSARTFARHMTQRRSGRIIMISSLTAEIGIPNIAAYAASRGGIRQLAVTMAVELAASGVTVNCIGPGRVGTRMTADLQADPVALERTLRVIPMGRWGKPEDIGGAAVFFASDAANYITGQSLYVDGGWLAAGGNLLG